MCDTFPNHIDDYWNNGLRRAIRYVCDCGAKSMKSYSQLVVILLLHVGVLACFVGSRLVPHITLGSRRTV